MLWADADDAQNNWRLGSPDEFRPGIKEDIEAHTRDKAAN